MEIVVPLFALSSLYVINNQSKNKNSTGSNASKEGFGSRGLPNTNIPDRNYPSSSANNGALALETDHTSKLSTVNRFENAGGVYTDKYFSPTGAQDIVQASRGASGSQQYQSLTGEKVDSNYFQHNNMVPFFGSNVRSSHINANTSESILDNYVGSGSQTIIKKEVAPMFSPAENAQWAYGAPSNTDFIQSRVNPSMRMANVKPFEEEMVGPGLGLGYSTQGAGGFNSGMMMRDQWMDKNVDQLRVENKPKAGGIGLFGHEGPANSAIKNMATREQMGIVEKNRPDRTFDMGAGTENHRMFTTVGASKGETLRPILIDRDTARQTTTTDYIGAAGFHNTGDYVAGEYMPSHHQSLGAVPLGVANAGGRQYAHDADYGIKSKMAYPNNRSANKQDSYFGMVSGSLGASVAPLLDILRPSRKENVVGTLRPYQNAGTRVPQSYLFNPADRLGTTIRETTENSKFHLNVDRHQRGGAYEVTEHQMVENNRQTTGDFYYAGIAGAGPHARQPKSYESGYNQRNNDIKSATIQGYMVQGNMGLKNAEINMRQSSRDDMLKNSRPITGTMPYQSVDVANMGQLQGQQQLYQNIQADRNDGSILEQLKGNPYTVTYKP